MLIDNIGIIVDFGLVVLIWIIQRIVYPSFKYYSYENLIIWHKRYISRFGPIVIPLMFAELGISIYQVIAQTNLHTFINLFIVIVLWLSTFIQFVPIHSKLSKGIIDEKSLTDLVSKNWLRTILWSLLFIFNCTAIF